MPKKISVKCTNVFRNESEDERRKVYTDIWIRLIQRIEEEEDLPELYEGDGEYAKGGTLLQTVGGRPGQTDRDS